MLQDEKLAGYCSNPQIRVSSKTANIDEYGFSRGSPHILSDLGNSIDIKLATFPGGGGETHKAN